MPFAQASDVGVPYSSVFRESGSWANDPLRDQVWSTDPQLKLGDDSLRIGKAGLGLRTDLDTPLKISGPPQDAMLRLWRLYLDIPRSYAEIIASDNANQQEHGGESGIIGIIATDFTLHLQLNDRLALSGGGRFIYLPFEGEAGFQGTGFFGDGFDFSADIDADPGLFLAAQFDGTIGKWDVLITDRIGIHTDDDSSLYARTREEATLGLLMNNDFDEVDRLGTYSLGGGYTDDDESANDDFQQHSDSDSRWEYDLEDKYNRFTLGFSRLIPTDTLASLTYFRSDQWGRDDDELGGDQDNSEWSHGVNVSLRNQHHNMRFKPYASYTATEESGDDYWQHAARLGVSGPLTEYTDLNANIGYSWHKSSQDESASRDLLWRVSLHNELNELTSHRLSYSRSVQEPEDEIHTTLSYSLHRTLGPYLEGTLYANWTEEDESNGQGDGHSETEYNVGAGLFWDVSSRLSVRLTAFLVAVQEEDTDDDYEEYRVKLSANYDITETLSLWGSYEYIHEDHENPGESYIENVLRMRLTKRW